MDSLSANSYMSVIDSEFLLRTFMDWCVILDITQQGCEY